MKNLLIVGLGNPDTEYESTRHNVGAQFVTKLAESYFIKLKKNLIAKKKLNRFLISTQAKKYFDYLSKFN